MTQPTSARASDSVIYSDIARVISLRIIIIILLYALVKLDVVALVVVIFEELFQTTRLFGLVRLAFLLSIFLLLVVSYFLALTRLPLS